MNNKPNNKQKLWKKIGIWLITLASIQTVAAANWSSTNVQLLHGSGYQLGEDQRTIFTFEHANTWSHGDNFFFLDVTEPSSHGTTFYSEFSPRFSLSKLSGKKISVGIIKDTFIATGVEMGKDLHSRLLGLGTSFNVKGFSYANINLYIHESTRDWVTEDTGLGGQVNVNWALPFSIQHFSNKQSKWVFEGHFDYSFKEKKGSHPKANNLNAAPRLLLDVGNFVQTPGQILAGIEYQLWRNKFGIDGVNENIAQFMVKWVF